MNDVQSVSFDDAQPRAGKLAASQTYQTIGGRGSGRVCGKCGAVIPKNRMQIAVVYAPESGMESLVLHVKCFAAWLGTDSGSEW